MKILLSLLLLMITVLTESQAQFTRYIIKLKNKGGTPYSFTTPLSYLSQRALDRRTRYGIAIDSTDLPVTPSYITQIRNVPNVTILNISKWLNSVTIQTTDSNAITSINAFPFVQSVKGLASRVAYNGLPSRNKFEQEEVITSLLTQRLTQITTDYFNYGTSSFNEIHLHHGEFLHNIGLRGQGMQIAFLDGGFQNYISLKAFDSVNINGQILTTWDFVAGNASVVEDHPHGMQCLSTIAANIPGQFTGKAPKANFHLFRTEDVNSEYPIEEHNWACGAERADSLGSDVISSSLGYNTFDNSIFDHTYAQMNGNTTMCATAAGLAAKKGIIVFNAVGNEGGNSWNFLVTPSDGDSIVAVGAVNIAGVVADFSSFGPSSDGQIKPDMASVGVNALIQNTDNTIGIGNGTSFACPNMAGMGTCLWQGFPEFNNIKIIRAMQLAGSIAGTPDNRIGYGIPDMKTAFANLLIDFSTANSTANACNVTVNWTSKDISAMKYEIERKVPGEVFFTKVGEMSPQAGSILANHNYQFNNTLISVNQGIVSYRIRQIIDTAIATLMSVYTDTTEITTSAGCFATGTGNTDPVKESFTIQPNPVSGSNVTLIIETAYAVNSMSVAIFDSKGGLIMKFKESKGTGKKNINLPVNKLASGKYYIKILNGQKPIGTAEMIKL